MRENPTDQPYKLKGRRRLLQSLQRMSSSPALNRRGRSASTGYTSDGKASLSCISLSSTYTSCFGDGGAPQLYDGLNARPVTPVPRASPAQRANDGPPIRLVATDAGLLTNQPRTVGLPVDLRPTSRGAPTPTGEAPVDAVTASPPAPKTKTFDFWKATPDELKMTILSYLSPKELVRCSAVCKTWNKWCYDGQLWSNVDASEYYRDISADGLVKLITAGGPFVRDLNLRGCIQLQDKWSSEGQKILDVCRNVVNFSIEGCRLDKPQIQHFLIQNRRLENINLTGLSSVFNSAMRTIAECCPLLETLNVSWCNNVDTRGLKRIVQSCPQLKDLRASEIEGFKNEDFCLQLFERNTLERLVISRTDLTNRSLKALMWGPNPEFDVLTDRPMVPPRRFKHLDLHQCTDVTDDGIRSLVHTVPELEGLQISQCSELSDLAVIDIIRSTPLLTHLELEDLENLTNDTLIELANAPCASRLEHLNISYCEVLGDIGMLQIMKNCTNIRSLEMDNTRISDLTLMEASARARKRGYNEHIPEAGLRLVVFDCANVTWAGVKEVLSSNCYIPRSGKSNSAVVTITQTASDSGVPLTPKSGSPSPSPSPAAMVYPNHIVSLKCFYGWQMTVDEHTKRVLRGDLAAASRLDRKWADYMMATEEAGAAGAGARRRRRRAREAERLYNAADDDEDVFGIGGLSAFGGRRRRAQSGNCAVM